MSHPVLLAMRLMMMQTLPWVDIRLRRDDVPRARSVLKLSEKRLLFTVDRQAELEWELSVEGLDMREAAEILDDAGIEYLAIRQR